MLYLQYITIKCLHKTILRIFTTKTVVTFQFSVNEDMWSNQRPKKFDLFLDLWCIRFFLKSLKQPQTHLPPLRVNYQNHWSEKHFSTNQCAADVIMDRKFITISVVTICLSHRSIIVIWFNSLQDTN